MYVAVESRVIWASEKMTQDEKTRIVQGLYEDLLHVANRFLHSAKNYSISVLRLENPTYAEIAKQFHKVCTIIELLADDIQDPLVAGKAREYLELMEGIAQAISNDDADLLNTCVTTLEKRPFL